MDVSRKLPTPSSMCSGVGCSAVELEDKWGGLVVSECQLLQPFLGLIPAFCGCLCCSLFPRVLPGSAVQRKLQCLWGWGGCRELGDDKISFALKSSASKKSFGLWMNAKVHGPWSSLGQGCSCFSQSDLPSPALSLSYCNSQGDVKMPQPCPELSWLLNCASSQS